jgi:hypothetical protein
MNYFPVTHPMVDLLMKKVPHRQLNVEMFIINLLFRIDS